MQRSRYLQLTVLAGALALIAGGATPVHANIINLSLDTAVNVGKDPTKSTGSTSVQTGLSGSPADAVWTLTGTGDDVWAPPDRFQFAYTTLTGDGGITARLLTETGGATGGWSKVGTMLRETLDPGAMDSFNAYPNGASNLLQPSWRIKANAQAVDFGNSQNTPGGGGAHKVESAPLWLRTQRQGQTYQNLISNDGVNWMSVGSATVPIDASKAILAGLFITQNGAGKPNIATLDNVTVTPDVIQPNLLPGPTGIMAEPGNGVVLLTFNNVAGASGYNVYRRDVGQTADQGVLLNAKPITVGYLTDATVTNGKQYLYFAKTVVPDAANPKKATAEGLARSSDALVAPNVPIPSNVAGSPGYQVYYWSTTNAATVDLTTTPGTLAVKASGGDIWGANVADSGTFIATPVAGDYSISAEILAQPTNSVKANKQAKAGVMIRDGVGPSDRNAFVFSSCGRDPGVKFEGKTIGGTNNGLYSDDGTKLADTKFPLWLKLTKAGAVVRAFQSNDGATYTEIGKGRDFVFLSPVTFAGLAFCGQTDGAYTTATFDAASVKIQ